ncbi:hypothetical protein GCM10012320_18260 [Sinomonas cellulolyticus]|nr:hypothetical protein GCM10012320_18260 [Sinomonas sp. KCTC 49339]
MHASRRSGGHARAGKKAAQALGIAALAQLVGEAPDVEAAKFAATALDPIVFPGDEIELVDGSQQAGAQSEDQQTEES